MAAHLVVGGDGLIGAALVAFLRRSGAEVLATSRRTAAHDDGMFLDLAADVRWVADDGRLRALARREGGLVAYLAAGMTGIARCENDLEGSRVINVVNTVQLAKCLLHLGARVVFLSSNAVFSGRTPHPSEHTAPDPETIYGKQKAGVEQALAGLGSRSPAVHIVRLTKVVSGELALFQEWIQGLRSGASIEAYENRIFSPISIGYTMRALWAIAHAASGGTYHVTGARDLSYFAFAQMLRERLHARGCVRRVEAPSRAEGLVQRYSALGPTLAGMSVGLKPQEPMEVVSELVEAS